MKIMTIVFALVALALSSPVLSHAMLDRASPSVGGKVKGSPAKVELWFSAELEPAFSTVKVVDHAGKQVDKRDQTFDSRDRSHVVVSLPVLPPGRYRVIWRALSIDTHSTAGDFVFEVAP